MLLVFVDAFGRRFLERHDDHALVRGLDTVHEISSQFPSTTTAHVTTMHTGLPVGAHGLYEWNVLEPALGRIVTPLRATYAGDDEDGALVRDGFALGTLLPDGRRFYERLDAPSWVLQPDRFSPSAFDGVAVRGADLRPYDRLAHGLDAAVAALRSVAAGYAYVYYDVVDAIGHLHGPSSPEFERASLRALDTLYAGLRQASGITVLLTADHGQVDVDPSKLVWLDDLHPPLARLALRPAGSARDVFLHVPEDEIEATLEALEPHVEAHRVADLLAEGAFGADVGSRLRDRLASVVVLPPSDRGAWLRAAVDPACAFRGHHGGRTDAETATWLGEWHP